MSYRMLTTLGYVIAALAVLFLGWYLGLLSAEHYFHS
jgi:hypothetical protein